MVDDVVVVAAVSLRVVVVDVVVLVVVVVVIAVAVVFLLVSLLMLPLRWRLRLMCLLLLLLLRLLLLLLLPAIGNNLIVQGNLLNAVLLAANNKIAFVTNILLDPSGIISHRKIYLRGRQSESRTATAIC